METNEKRVTWERFPDQVWDNVERGKWLAARFGRSQLVWVVDRLGNVYLREEAGRVGRTRSSCIAHCCAVGFVVPTPEEEALWRLG